LVLFSASNEITKTVPWIRPLLGPTQACIQWVPAALSSWVERPGRETDHSLPTSAEVKNRYIYRYTLHTSSWRSAQGQLSIFPLTSFSVHQEQLRYKYIKH
jgi:hypothetical protein